MYTGCIALGQVNINIVVIILSVITLICIGITIL